MHRLGLCAASRPARPIRSRAEDPSRAGISALSTLTIVAVVLVMVLVSLPRLRGFALRQNEQDALLTTRLLAGELADVPLDAGSLEVLVREHALGPELADAEYLAAGTLLRRHGYLFLRVPWSPPPGGPGSPRAVRAAERGPEDGPGCAVLAWPWRAGRTGTAAFLGVGSELLLGHPNRDLGASGPDAPPPGPWTERLPATGWVPLP